MKKPYLAVLFVALVATMNLGAQEPAGNATADEWIAYLTATPTAVSAVPLSSNLNAFITATLQKDVLTDGDSYVLYNVAWNLFEQNPSSVLGNSIRTKIAGAGLPQSSFEALRLSIKQSTNPAEILQLASGNAGVAWDIEKKASELNAPGLFDAYCATVTAKGLTGPYANWFKTRIATLPSSEQIAALEAEIKALLSQPQSPERDMLLVEYRGQRLVLKELAQ